MIFLLEIGLIVLGAVFLSLGLVSYGEATLILVSGAGVATTYYLHARKH